MIKTLPFRRFMIRRCLLVLLVLGSPSLLAQKHVADSLQKVLLGNLKDTARAGRIRDLSQAMYRYDPDSALLIAYDGLRFAKEIEEPVHISKMYEMIAIILTKTGNFSKALQYYIENLKIEESLPSEDGIICANINIGIVYAYMLDYDNALKSYTKANNLLYVFKDTSGDIAYEQRLKYSTLLNIGDAFEKKMELDSAFFYYNASLRIANSTNDDYKKGLAMLGIANVFAAMNKNEEALIQYKTSLAYLQKMEVEESLCDVSLGMAKLFTKLNKKDSAIYYARSGLFFAKKNRFLSKQLDLSNFLNKYYASTNQVDSAYFYLSTATTLKDSILGDEKVRVAQQILFDENIRQLELIEKAAQEKEERRQQLQHIFIGILIPSLFLFTLLLARIKIQIKWLKFLGVISLLFLFEYLTLLLHPLVQEITHHTPIFEILIFVCIAALLIPAHHKIEHWLIEKLVHRVQSSQLTHDSTQTSSTENTNNLKAETDQKAPNKTTLLESKKPRK
nr:tetratricopeptide repeat protein [Chitinophagaceae bacterium]